MDDEGSAEEDEETLQLQLQAIEAKLKLKRLRQAKASTAARPLAENDSGHSGLRSPVKSLARNRSEAAQREAEGGRLRHERARQDVQVPLSPPRRAMPTQGPKSPGRIRLGIGKGLTGRDVSLRRAPTVPQDEDRWGQDSTSATDRPSARAASTKPQRSRYLEESERPKKSFSERLAELRANDLSRKEKKERIQAGKSKEFVISAAELADYKRAAANALAEDPLGLAEGRDDDQKAASTESSQFEPFSGFQISKRILSYSVLTRILSGKKLFQIPDLLKVVKAPAYDAPDVEEDWVLVAIIASKSSPRDHKDDGKTGNDGNNSSKGRGKFMALTLTDLKWELDLFLFSSAFDRFWKLTPGTIVAILNPSVMPPPPAKRDTGRFSLTLHSSEETVLEIGTARDLGFCKSVKRDGSFCKTWVDQRHTEFCDFHVDATVRKTRAGRMEISTMSATPFGPGGSGRSRTSAFRGGGGSRDNDHHHRSENGLKRDGGGGFRDRASHSQVYVTGSVPGFGRTTANLLDDEDVDPDAFHRGYSKEERLRRQLVEQEKERDIARCLGGIGSGGMGGAYLRARGAADARPTTTTTADDTADADGPQTSRNAAEAAHQQQQQQQQQDLADLKKGSASASSVRLSPIKRKHGVMDSSAVAPVGWGGAYKRGLTLPSAASSSAVERDGRRKETVATIAAVVVDDDDGPATATATASHGVEGTGRARKKTRFLTARGIREAGRESLGGGGGSDNLDHDQHLPQHHDDNDNDDDDGLDIIR
ncbi:MAG: hypothetical protein M1826_004798 [Phylliscum demangeonii]|nr:MAG: hypothetical protein M1826_004798 [Phylliscum demangeonii]